MSRCLYFLHAKNGEFPIYRVGWSLSWRKSQLDQKVVANTLSQILYVCLRQAHVYARFMYVYVRLMYVYARLMAADCFRNVLID